MKTIYLVAIAMIVFGGGILAYNQFSYTTTEQVLKIGPITANAERTHTVAVPPLLGWLLLGSGACMLIFAALTRKD
jgi:hypothetical protein